MKKNIQLFAVLAVIALFSGYGVAYAQTDGNQESGRPQGPSMMGGHRPLGLRAGGMGSTTWTKDGRTSMRNGSSTEMMRGEGFRGVPGIVTEVATDHFLMTARGLGKDHASTTLTVQVSSTTKFETGSSTGAYSDVVVGAKVEVLGKVASSTKSIAADHVRINNGQGHRLNGDDQGDKSGQESQGQGHGFIQKFKNFLDSFRGKQAGTVGNASDTPSGAAVAISESSSEGFMGGAYHFLFGWMH